MRCVFFLAPYLQRWIFRSNSQYSDTVHLYICRQMGRYIIGFNRESYQTGGLPPMSSKQSCHFFNTRGMGEFYNSTLFSSCFKQCAFEVMCHGLFDQFEPIMLFPLNIPSQSVVGMQRKRKGDTPLLLLTLQLALQAFRFWILIDTTTVLNTHSTSSDTSDIFRSLISEHPMI